MLAGKDWKDFQSCFQIKLPLKQPWEYFYPWARRALRVYFLLCCCVLLVVVIVVLVVRIDISQIKAF
jgi:hypothetical protein